MSRQSAASQGFRSRPFTGRTQFGGPKAGEAKRLKDLELVCCKHTRLLADAELEKAALKEIALENL